MVEIIPAIMPRSFADLSEKMEAVNGAARTVQIDLCDGIYVSTKTWPFHPRDKHSLDALLSEEAGMPFWETLDIELDCMVKNPAKELDMLVRLGPKRIVFHLGTLEDPEAFFNELDPYIKSTIEIGLAVLPETPVEEFIGLVPLVSFVQCMGIAEVGVQGNPFDERVLGQLRALREAFPKLPLSVDGSVNRDTAQELAEAGATRLVIGSAIFNSDSPAYAVKEFKGMVQ